MFTAITNPAEIKSTYDRLARRLRKGAVKVRARIGWRPGYANLSVYWHQKERFWVAMEPTKYPGRYWLPFGTEPPGKPPQLNITCEINVPRLGMNRRCAGVLLRSADGGLYLGHTGKIGGGQKGVGKTEFLKTYPRKLQLINWSEGKVPETSEMLVLGRVDAPNFLSNLAGFVVEVDNFKAAVRSSDLDSEIARAERLATTEGKFDPRNQKDARRKTLQSIVERRGQSKFRKKLLRAYENRCAITGFDCPDALEAAHIRGYGGDHTDHIANGILLRGDVHTLFDLRKICITRDYKVAISPEIKQTTYANLSGRKLHLPKDPDSWPDKRLLAEHKSKSRI